MSRARQGYLGLAALLVAGVVLIAIELSRGALDFGESTAADPCAPREPFPGDGFEATLQDRARRPRRRRLRAGTTREELVLSFDSQLGGDVDWDQETLERALRSGLEEAIADAEERGSIGGLRGNHPRELVSRAPRLADRGRGDLADLFGGIFDRR